MSQMYQIILGQELERDGLAGADPAGRLERVLGRCARMCAKYRLQLAHSAIKPFRSIC
jgi:hypothetical protein